MPSALMVWGGWEGHEPEKAVGLFAPLLREAGLEVEVLPGITVYDDLERLKRCALIVQCVTWSTISDEQVRNLAAAVEAGVGFGGWHGGVLDSFRSTTQYQYLAGGQYVAHPGGIREVPVQIVDHGHPITAGLPDFSVRTEHYFMNVSPDNHVLAATTFDGQDAPWIAGAVMPVAFTRRWGAGRVFACSLGHVAADFDVPEARELVRRGLLWAARQHPSTPERTQP
jgi:type 1 glutamine amidotransferase